MDWYRLVDILDVLKELASRNIITYELGKGIINKLLEQELKQYEDK